MSVIKNYFYNTVYQVLILIIPLLTMPYLTRIFTPGQLGLNSYTLSIVNYFMLIGTLGMQIYGNRQIAFVRDDKEKLRRYFWSLYVTQGITSLLALIAYYVFVGTFVNQDKFVYIIQGLNMLTVFFDISWLFMGLEDFKKVVIRNSIAKLLGLVSIFVFVRSSDDLVLYILLTIIINGISFLTMWIYVPKNIGKIVVDIDIIKKTIKPLISLFLPQIASQVYMLLSRTLVGVLSTNEQVAFYDYSQKIVRVILSLISSIGIVMLPMISNIISKGRREEVNKIVEQAFKIVSYVAFPMAFGVMAISKILVSWFLGKDYSSVGGLIAISSIIIIAVSWANIIGVQYLIGTKQENKYTQSVVIAAVINFIMNLIVIPKFGALGAVVAIIVAEFVGSIVQLVLTRKQLPVLKMVLATWKFLVGSIVMCIVVMKVGDFINKAILANIIQVIVGGVIYIAMMFILKDDTQIIIIEKIKAILLKKRVSDVPNI
ncbi:flippase [Clostridium sp. C8-1-8]|uniref:flippase n=1 Tax=Clostridium sp. C8-1-8 TaxID=2698831 RepID=UPI001371C461|nr:flippase [Clostridium sp. C8-1-8]